MPIYDRVERNEYSVVEGLLVKNERLCAGHSRILIAPRAGYTIKCERNNHEVDTFWMTPRYNRRTALRVDVPLVFWTDDIDNPYPRAVLRRMTEWHLAGTDTEYRHEMFKRCTIALPEEGWSHEAIEDRWVNSGRLIYRQQLEGILAQSPKPRQTGERWFGGERYEYPLLPILIQHSKGTRTHITLYDTPTKELPGSMGKRGPKVDLHSLYGKRILLSQEVWEHFVGPYGPDTEFKQALTDVEVGTRYVTGVSVSEVGLEKVERWKSQARKVHEPTPPPLRLRYSRGKQLVCE